MKFNIIKELNLKGIRKERKNRIKNLIGHMQGRIRNKLLRKTMMEEKERKFKEGKDYMGTI